MKKNSRWMCGIVCALALLAACGGTNLNSSRSENASKSSSTNSTSTEKTDGTTTTREPSLLVETPQPSAAEQSGENQTSALPQPTPAQDVPSQPQENEGGGQDTAGQPSGSEQVPPEQTGPEQNTTEQVPPETPQPEQATAQPIEPEPSASQPTAPQPAAPTRPTPTPAPANTPSQAGSTGRQFGVGAPPVDYTTYYASLQSGYLALRTAMAFDSSNEIGQIQNGEPVYVVDQSSGNYWYVYVPSSGMYGYVNSQYLTASASGGVGAANYWMVRVESGYLALRSAMAYDSSNELGQLHTGDTVQVLNTADRTYWYVYAPSLNLYGYVNSDYLTADTRQDYNIRTVRVDSGYLALRSAMAYDSSNELGRLYNGDTVQVLRADDSTYWYVYAPSLNLYGYVNWNYLY